LSGFKLWRKDNGKKFTGIWGHPIARVSRKKCTFLIR
jgi:hypothetical protein